MVMGIRMLEVFTQRKEIALLNQPRHKKKQEDNCDTRNQADNTPFHHHGAKGNPVVA